MRCTLIYNPAAGRNRSRKSAQLHEIEQRLSRLGHPVELIQTIAPGSAALQVHEAIANKAEMIFACGGDGTVHDVLQGYVAHAKDSSVCMGVLPMGSANALARNLGLSLDPVTAAMQQISGEVVSLPVGKITYAEASRYFSVMAGMGPDGLLTYEVLTTHKAGLGRLAYYLHAARLFVTRPFPAFEIEYFSSSSQASTARNAIAVMAVQVRDLGGLFGSLVPSRQSPYGSGLSVILITPPSLLALPFWFLFGWLHMHRWNPFLHSVSVDRLVCKPAFINSHFQADGEWLGRGPIELSFVPDALHLRLPAHAVAKVRPLQN
ncbi:MAG TPA: diacylglycerol kinase family protein [Acidobacteriaceae bacterium]|nr:diacylglycerol kinase family protein [Acidobacteriaceae bacterium]